jgi:hypothetical protein
MAKINLEEDDLRRFYEAVNDGTEPEPELAGRLFPSFMEKLAAGGKFDFEALNHIRIPLYLFDLLTPSQFGKWFELLRQGQGLNRI